MISGISFQRASLRLQEMKPWSKEIAVSRPTISHVHTGQVGPFLKSSDKQQNYVIRRYLRYLNIQDTFCYQIASRLTLMRVTALRPTGLTPGKL